MTAKPIAAARLRRTNGVVARPVTKKPSAMVVNSRVPATFAPGGRRTARSQATPTARTAARSRRRMLTGSTCGLGSCGWSSGGCSGGGCSGGGGVNSGSTIVDAWEDVDIDVDAGAVGSGRFGGCGGWGGVFVTVDLRPAVSKADGVGRSPLM
ncbi:MAG: hypothetical protein R2710_27020 [Acidimicrobiales bacterium]